MLRRMTTCAALLGLLTLVGCAAAPDVPPARAAAPAPTPAPKPQAAETSYLAKPAVKSDAKGGDDTSAVESALNLSDRNAKLTDDLMHSQQQRYELEDTNRKLADQVSKLQADNQAAQKELAEAGQMIVEMRHELDQWKNNVLGFRDEIRDAQKSQNEALRKVLVLLGAEVPPTAATQPAAASADAAPAGPDKIATSPTGAAATVVQGAATQPSAVQSAMAKGQAREIAR